MNLLTAVRCGTVGFVKQMHPNHITAASLEGFQVLVLANEVCLSDQQCAAIREFVRSGGGLIATHETSLYDLETRPRGDFGLANLFGARLARQIMPHEGQRIAATEAAPSLHIWGGGIPWQIKSVTVFRAIVPILPAAGVWPNEPRFRRENEAAPIACTTATCSRR